MMNRCPGGYLGIKVDVDTLVGHQKGVPRLLEQLEEAGVRATFFFSAGPDRSGVAIRRVFTQRGFVAKMLRNRAPSTYGLRTLLQGTLLPAPLILQADPGIVREVARAGHEVGVHGWDHIEWHDNLSRMSCDQVRDHLERAFEAVALAAGTRPACFAAPGWQCSPQSLAWHDAAGLVFASDVRGFGGPFRPRIGDTTFATPQVPTSLPTLDEVWGRQVRSAEDAAAHWLQLLQVGANVVTVHAEIEGLAMPGALPALVAGALARGMDVGPIGSVVAGLQSSELPARSIAPVSLQGRAGKVWCIME
ncbi:MAG: polysaccharide deacetylase family protein [Armatimonadetes bacterium]|nr:polysaccharide deacetylase family protein [Armatimonadota bacterium]